MRALESAASGELALLSLPASPSPRGGCVTSCRRAVSASVLGRKPSLGVGPRRLGLGGVWHAPVLPYCGTVPGAHGAEPPPEDPFMAPVLRGPQLRAWHTPHRCRRPAPSGRSQMLPTPDEGLAEGLLTCACVPCSGPHGGRQGCRREGIRGVSCCQRPFLPGACIHVCPVGSLHWRLGKSVDSSSVRDPPLPLRHPARPAPCPPASFRNVCGDGGWGGGGGCPVGAPARALGVVVIGPVPRGLGNRSFRPGLFQAPRWSPSFVSSLPSSDWPPSDSAPLGRGMMFAVQAPFQGLGSKIPSERVPGVAWPEGRTDPSRAAVVWRPRC